MKFEIKTVKIVFLKTLKESKPKSRLYNIFTEHVLSKLGIEEDFEQARETKLALSDVLAKLRAECDDLTEEWKQRMVAPGLTEKEAKSLFQRLAGVFPHKKLGAKSVQGLMDKIEVASWFKAFEELQDKGDV